ncbi:Eco57I restriction-modification methylase domain-containing protein [Bacteroides acidifaciens]|uniref:site-specific DNA-methyltransferase (adenine-specific) n=1 Tax=Bacteroides acidifaciens TaxID=85831 RepID=A0A3L8AB87_9BACE|nr:restriction endonuclease [Bacteroides acidifaciens]RLT81426.1 restriction endonuclease [Bacteroides acidifaciens]
MDYTSIHIYGHLLSDDILHEIETDLSMLGNREQDFNLDVSLTAKIDNAWSSLRNDWKLFAERNMLRDPYGTKSVRRLMERFFSSLDYQLDYQPTQIEANERKFDIPYICPELGQLPVIIVGDKTGDVELDMMDKCTLDQRVKGEHRQKSPHATMLDYLNSTEHIYGIVTNGQVLRLIRNTGQLVKLTYIEFDLRRMVEEDHYAEFCLLFRLMHTSRFSHSSDDACIMEQWFNRSIESGNRIRAGLSDAVQKAMEILGRAVVCGKGDGNEAFRQAIMNGEANSQTLNKELIHFIYRVLFLFIIEDRNLVYHIGDPDKDADYDRKVHCQDIYKKFYAVSRLRGLSELPHLRSSRYHDLWEGLMDSFHLFEDGAFGAPLCIKPLGGILFDKDTLHYLRYCRITNKELLEAFACLNEFKDEKQNRVKINYSSLDVEEFGSVYEGILEMRAVITQGTSVMDWGFTFGAGLDRKSSSSYYTRPDLVQNLIRTTLEPVIRERIAQCQTTEEKVRSLLSMKVCDAASGSGHIILAMARTLAWYICTLRTGEDNPASQDYREALREVIQKCIYAVDYNPDAVELCKVVLWIEGYCAGKPLSFLDHHVRCGNSVVGVTNLDSLLDGVPKEAFSAEDKETKKKIIDLNKAALKDVALVQAGKSAGYAVTLFSGDIAIQSIDDEQVGLAGKVKEINALPEDSLLQELAKQSKWEELMQSPRVKCLRRACDIYTYSFFKQFKKEDFKSEFDEEANTFTSFDIPYTRTVFNALQEIKYLDYTAEEMEGLQVLSDSFKREVDEVARANRFFHWCVEFPEVFADGGGFDVMCGNPPWDKIKVEDKKWFESHGRFDIVNAGTAAQRKKAIANLPIIDPILYKEYTDALAFAEAESRFVRFSGRFPLTATGDIDLYPMFAELCLSFSIEAWGLVLPTGIAFNDSNKKFFAKLVEQNRLISLYDFENREKLFDIDSTIKFCLLTAGRPQDEPRKVSGGFYLTRLDHLLDPNRIYTMESADFVRLNPNTKTCAVFRTSKDAGLTAKIYRHSQILLNETTGENPWQVKFGSMIHMSNDSQLFRTYAQLTDAGAIKDGNNFYLNGVEYIPLYEGKMFWLFNHHYGKNPITGPHPDSGKLLSPSILEYQNSKSILYPYYWIPKEESGKRVIKLDKKNNITWAWKHKWLIAFRAQSKTVNERTFIVSLIPGTDCVGAGNSSTLLFEERGAMPGSLLLSMMSSLVFDFVVRQKVGGKNVSNFFVKQFPVLTPEQIQTSGYEREIVERVARLCWFNHDLDGWMEELRKQCPADYDLPDEPVIWNEEQRTVWQAELDAIYAHLYGLSTEDLRYILDPEDVCGKGCINETFRVLKDREIRELGEYRTKRLVLEAWNKFGFDN